MKIHSLLTTALSFIFGALPLAAQSITATGEVTPAGSTSPTWAIAGELRVGNYNTGTLTVAGPGTATLNTGSAYLGFDLSGHGTVTVNGADSTWTSSSQINVGQWATGLLNLQNGGRVYSKHGVIGAAYDAAWGLRGKGTVNIDGAGSLWQISGGTTSSLVVGQSGTGTLNLTHGGAASSAYGHIGMNASGIGTVTVSDAGSTLTQSVVLIVGDEGKGTLNIQSGGHVQSANAYVGYFGTGDGTVTITGGNSLWSIDDQFYVGSSNGAKAVVNVENGGSISSKDSVIGIYSGSDGAVQVTGSNSEWSASSYIAVGYGGVGKLTVDQGGIVTTPDVVLGYEAGGSGQLLLNGNSESGRGTLATASIAEGGGNGSIQFDGGRLRATASSTNFLSNFESGDVTIAAGGAHLDTNGFDLIIQSVLGGTGGLTKEGAGSLTLSGANSFLGTTVVSGGLLTLSGSLASTEVVVQSGAAIGGDGSLAGNLTLLSGAMLQFTSDGALSVAGTVTLDAGFGVDDLFGLSSSVATGTYLLITDTPTDFSTLGFDNWGVANAYDLGDGKLAYFDQNGLSLVVTTAAIPEPATTALIAGLVLLGFAGYQRHNRRRVASAQ